MDIPTTSGASVKRWSDTDGALRSGKNSPLRLATARGAATPRRRQRRAAISCVIPAYNEADNLGPLLTALTAKLAALASRWEVIVVDDGSRDATAQVLAPWLARGGIRYVRLSRNFGKEAALTAGIDRALGDVVILMDADLQHPVGVIPQMLQAWGDGADMVSAARVNRADEGLAKRLGTRLFYALVNNDAAVKIPVDAGDFRLMDRRVVDALKSLPERNRFMKGLYAWVGFENTIVRYTPDARASGKSRFSMRKLARLALTGVTAFTNAPLRWWSGIGALIAALALGYGGWIVVENLIYGVDVPGWATVVAGMMFLSGVQLLSVGILGEYLGRVFDEVKQRPVYIVGEECGQGINRSIQTQDSDARSDTRRAQVVGAVR
jgi:glycosyltransferase involved in cell wall biosynthesis